MLKPCECAADVLERAADVLDVDGWTRCTMNHRTRALPHCAVGALFVAGSEHPAMVEAWDALIAMVGPSVMVWNDKQRTKDEVTSTMRSVAAVLRAKDGASLGVRQRVPESTVVTDSHNDAAVMPEALFR